MEREGGKGVGREGFIYATYILIIVQIIRLTIAL